jgi:hypothetical protein
MIIKEALNTYITAHSTDLVQARQNMAGLN